MVVFVDTSAFINLFDEDDEHLVDAASFVVMRDEAIDTVFAFDRHFREQGFKVL